MRLWGGAGKGREDAFHQANRKHFVRPTSARLQFGDLPLLHSLLPNLKLEQTRGVQLFQWPNSHKDSAVTQRPTVSWDTADGRWSPPPFFCCSSLP